MSEALVRYGFPLFWIGLGVIQWYWPAAIFSGLSNEDVTPGARGFAVLWLCVGSALGFAFAPLSGVFSALFVPGVVLLLTGALQWAFPAWASPLEGAMSERSFGTALAVIGAAIVGLSAL